MNIHYITGNQSKFDNAKKYLESYDISITQTKLDLQEIQSETGSEIALIKVREAYEQVGEPVFVNDASWSIPALNGFPGPFMKYITKWLSNEDILGLMRTKQDRTIILIDVIAYKDADQEKLFVVESKGCLLEVPQGATNGPEITRIISLSEDRHSLAQIRSEGFTEKEKMAWSNFATWLKARRTHS
jgi:non-canonical purine NTP pyrophosphatase (RdgB/HAM1 family)